MMICEAGPRPELLYLKLSWISLTCRQSTLPRHLGQVQGRHQHGLAVDDAVFHPHDVVGQRADLRADQGHAQAQVEGVLAGQGVVHQVAVLVVVADQAVGEEALGVWCVEARGRRVYSPPVAHRRLRFGDLTVEKCASS
ncbi:hypothetical protein APT63_06865 [Pseudomonas sp. 22-AL-CL-001]|nr:hypothetical protein APT63_06865 [Pseudomonas monteilii]